MIHLKSKISKYVFIITILLGGFLSAMTETIMNNALSTIMNELRVSETTAQWLSTGYIMVVGIMMPISVYFIHRFPLRRLFPTAIGIFLVGTLLGACASNFYILLLGRIIQALSVGISMPLVQNLMILLFPAKKRGFAIGISSIVIILGPAIGPTLAGWILNHYSWRMLFISLIPFTLVVLLLALLFTQNVTQTKREELDWLSFIESSIGLGTLLYGFSKIGVSTSNNLPAVLSIIIGTIFIILFVFRQLKIKHPLLEMRVFRSPSFTKTTILSAITSIAMLGGELIIPLYVQNVRGESAFVSGLILLPGALVMMVISPLAGALYDKIGIRLLSIIGFTILTVASLPMIWFNRDTSIWWITFLYAVRMIGIGLIMMQLSTSGVNALPERLVLHGNTVASTIRQVFSSLGTSLLVTIAAIFANHAQKGHSIIVAMQLGYSKAFLVVSIISLICLVVAVTLKNRTTPEIN